ncbi:MAG: hypothetical protein IPK59_02105 [Rhodospirillaceae bacterium]|nr:hypothetical protein [Rhodospirillaceae bacterium]
MDRIIIDGLKAPWRYPGGLILSSLPWVILNLIQGYYMAHYGAWEGRGDGERHWRAELTWANGSLFAAQALAFVSFFISWSRGLYLDRTEFRLFRFDRRLWWIARGALKLVLGLILIALGFWVASIIVGFVAGFIGLGWIFSTLAGLALIFALVWASCRFSILFTSIAVDEDPYDVIDVWDKTDGYAVRIFASLAPVVIMLPVLKALLLGVAMSTLFGSFASFRVNFAPLWGGHSYGDVAPLWMIACETALDWLYYAWLFATLTYIYRHMTPRPATDEKVVGVF